MAVKPFTTPRSENKHAALLAALDEALAYDRTYRRIYKEGPAQNVGSALRARDESLRRIAALDGLNVFRSLLALSEKQAPVAWQAKHPGEGYEWFQITKEVYDDRRHGAYEYRELYVRR